MSLFFSSIRLIMHERRVGLRHSLSMHTYLTVLLNRTGYTHILIDFFFQGILIKWQIVLSTWRNRTLKDVWFRNKTWWLSELPLPEPLRSPIRPCDFLCTYFPYHNRPWLFHTCDVVCSRGKTFCPLSPFPSSIWWSLLHVRLWPHGIRPGPQPCCTALQQVQGRGLSSLFWNQTSGGKEKGSPYLAWCTANSCFWEHSRCSAFNMQKFPWTLHPAEADLPPNIICKSHRLLFTQTADCCNEQLAQITIKSCLMLC